MSGAPEHPIACTLGADDLRARLAWIRRVTELALVSHRLDGTTLHLAYRPEARGDLQRIVDAERACCAFLEFDLADDDGQVALRIRAPAGGEVDARWLFEQFLPAPPSGACAGVTGGCA
jgi:hypothetical protein